MNDHNYTPSFFYYYTATTKIYPLSLHDALPIYVLSALVFHDRSQRPHHHRPVVRRLRSRVAAERARLDGGGRAAPRPRLHVAHLDGLPRPRPLLGRREHQHVAREANGPLYAVDDARLEAAAARRRLHAGGRRVVVIVVRGDRQRADASDPGGPGRQRPAHHRRQHVPRHHVLSVLAIHDDGGHGAHHRSVVRRLRSVPDRARLPRRRRP